MRHATLVILVLIWRILAACPSLAADPDKKPDGFRGIPWGERLDRVPNLTAVESEGDVIHYDRSGEKKTLGPIETRLIDYSFFKDRFFHASIIYERGFDVIEETLEEKYGKPDASRVKKDADGRQYALVEWVWPGEVYIGHRRFLDEDGGRIFYFYSPLADASMGRKTGPAKAAAVGPAGTYGVKKGDTLGGIAARHGVSLSALRAANGGLDPKKLKLGQSLVIPGAADAAPSPDTASPAVADEPRDAQPAAPPAPLAPPAPSVPLVPLVPPASPAAPAASAVPAAPATTGEEKPARSETVKPEAGAGDRRYAVVSGDVFSGVAKRFGVSQKALAQANPGVNPKKLSIGQSLVIPGGSAAPEEPEAARTGTAPKAPETVSDDRAGDVPPASEKAQAAPASAARTGAVKHVLAQGETISHLAARYGVSEKDILRANKIKNAKGLQIGQVITIPAPRKK